MPPTEVAGLACPKPRKLPNGQSVRCKSRRCPTCGILWAGDTRVRVRSNIEAYGGAVALGTITAPGSDVLPHDAAMRAWNRTAPARWRELHRAAAQVARRRHGDALRMLVWSWEYQRRGALHKHFVLGVDTAREMAAAHTYMLALDRLRLAHGFGFVSDTRTNGAWRSIGPERIVAERAGRYVAKYLAKYGEGGRLEVSETVMREDVPPLVVYVARSLTRVTGMTMRYLRFRRVAYVRGLPQVHPLTGELVSSIIERGAQDELRAWQALRQTDD